MTYSISEKEICSLYTISFFPNAIAEKYKLKSAKVWYRLTAPMVWMWITSTDITQPEIRLMVFLLVEDKLLLPLWWKLWWYGEVHHLKGQWHKIFYTFFIKKKHLPGTGYNSVANFLFLLRYLQNPYFIDFVDTR